MLAIFLYVILFSFLSLWKLHNYLYDNLDLAIFNTTLFNLVSGNGFFNAIHPPSYLGDHFSPILYALTPIYYFFRLPQTLLIIQTIFLGAAAWPLYKLATKILSPNQSLIIAILWLLNPVLHNLNLFEFHDLTMAIFFLLWAFYFYYEKKFPLFIIFCVLSLLVREDVSLIIICFSIIAWLDKKDWRWKIIPIILGGGWFIVAQKIIALNALSGCYKFSNYYSWLGQASFPQVLSHLLSFGNLSLFLTLFFPLLFIPLGRPKYLLLMLAPLASYLLTTQGGSLLLIQTHYGGFLIWPIYIALIFSLRKNGQNNRSFILKYQNHLLFILLLASVYGALTYGSILPILSSKSPDLTSLNKLTNKIPATAGLATTYSPLSNLSSRPLIQLLPYAYASKGQFMLTDYALSDGIQYLLIDWQEMFVAKVHLLNRYGNTLQSKNMSSNLLNILNKFTVTDEAPGFSLYQRSQNSDLPATIKASSVNFDEVKIIDLSSQSAGDQEKLTVTFGLSPDIQSQYFLEIKKGTFEKKYSLGYDLFNLQSTDSQILTMDIVLPLNDLPTVLNLYSWQQGYVYLDSQKSLDLKLPDAKLIDSQTKAPGK